MIARVLAPVSGVLLVMGTCIGAGMLALPVVTGVTGFIPAIVVNLFCCLFMMATGLLFLEAILWMEDRSNVLTIAGHFLGRWGKIISGISFLFLYYCLNVSYCAGGTPALASILYQLTGIEIGGVFAYLFFSILFGVIVYLGASVLNRINSLFMVGLFLSFFFLIGIGSTQVDSALLERSNWRLTLAATPTLFGAYGYHNLLPSLSSYLKRHVMSLRLAIVFGTLFTFIIYSIWQWMIIGTLTLEQIQYADTHGEPVTQALQVLTGYPWLVRLGETFGFFALVTSFMGVSFSMVDFLADGLKVSFNRSYHEGWKRLLLCAIVFIPPALFAAANPGIFIEAIGVAGGFGEAILNGLLPIGVVWIGRYWLKLPSQYSLFGGKPLLVILFLITFLIMGVEANHLFSRYIK